MDAVFAPRDSRALMAALTLSVVILSMSVTKGSQKISETEISTIRLPIFFGVTEMFVKTFV